MLDSKCFVWRSTSYVYNQYEPPMQRVYYKASMYAALASCVSVVDYEKGPCWTTDNQMWEVLVRSTANM